MLPLYFRQLNPQITSNPLGYCSRLSEKRKLILDLYFSWDNRKNTFDCFQAYVAARVGCRREYVNTVLGEFDRDGLIAKRGYWYEKCVYAVNPFFHQESVRKELSSVFETFKKHPQRYILSLMLLTLIASNAKASRSERYEEAAFVSHFRAPSYIVDAQTAPLMGERPILYAQHKPLNGKDEAPWPSEHCKCEICKIL